MCQTWDRYRKRGLILVIQAAGNRRRADDTDSLLLRQQSLNPSLNCCLCLLCGNQSFQPPQICIHRYVLIRHIDEPLYRRADDPRLRVEMTTITQSAEKQLSSRESSAATHDLRGCAAFVYALLLRWSDTPELTLFDRSV